MVLGFLLVALGSAMGGALRHGIGLLLPFNAQLDVFPHGTVVVNIVGSLVAGLLVGLAGPGGPLAANEETRLLLLVGFCGGFTTFSAFNVEMLAMLEQGEPFAALANLLVSLVLGLLAVLLGAAIGRAV